MQELEWLASENPADMLAWLAAADAERTTATDAARERSRLLTDRRARLFACACCRQAMKEYPPGDAIILRSFEDGNGISQPRARSRGVDAVQRLPAGEAAAWWCREGIGSGTANPTRASLLRDVVGNPFRPVDFVWMNQSLYPRPGRERRLGDSISDLTPVSWITPQVLTLARAAYEERGRKCEFCRGKGNFQTSGSYAECPRCRGPQGVGTGRIDDGTLDPVRLAVLSDALEEAGCDDHLLLRHLRRPALCVWCHNTGRVETPLKMGGPYGGVEPKYVVEPPRMRSAACICRGDCGPHVRGCWAISLVLGQS